MRLKSGQTAPSFSIEDIEGNPVRLEDFKGKKLMISFYRYASCPFCNLRVHQLIQKYDTFRKKGLTLLSFFQSSKEGIGEYVGKQKAPFPIIPDPQRGVYRLYHIESSKAKFLKGIAQIGKYKEAAKLGFKPGKREGDMVLVPADFLIDENQKIHRVYYGKDITDHLPIKEIEAFLK